MQSPSTITDKFIDWWNDVLNIIHSFKAESVNTIAVHVEKSENNARYFD